MEEGEEDAWRKVRENGWDGRRKGWEGGRDWNEERMRRKGLG